MAQERTRQSSPGVYLWNALITYGKNDTYVDAAFRSDGLKFVTKADGNIGNPLPSTPTDENTYWVLSGKYSNVGQNDSAAAQTALAAATAANAAAANVKPVVDKGAYATTTTYDVNNGVRGNGAYWGSKISGNLNNPLPVLPVTGNTAWYLIVQDGVGANNPAARRNGTGAPANTLGVDGDYYVDNATGNEYFRSAGTYSVTQNLRGPTGPSGLNPRGAWAPSTAYAIGDSVQFGGGTFRAPTSFTSGATFNPANWEATLPPPFLDLSGLTGGTNNRLVYVLSDGVTCRDVHPSLIDEIGYSALRWKDGNGLYWKSGATISGETGLTYGFVRAIQQQPSNTGANWRDVDPKAAQPTDLAPSVDQVYLEIGKVVSATQWEFRVGTADGTAPTPSARVDTLTAANYPRETSIPTARWDAPTTNPLLGAVWTSTYVNARTVATQFPNGVLLEFNAGSGTRVRRYAVDKTQGQTAQNIQGVFQCSKSGSAGEQGWFTRGVVGSTAGKVTALSFISDNRSTGTMKIVATVDDVDTVVASATAVGTGATWRIRWEAQGTLCRMKWWDPAVAEPADWQLTGYQSLVNAVGYTGALCDFASTWLTALGYVNHKGATATVA